MKIYIQSYLMVFLTLCMVMVSASLVAKDKSGDFVVKGVGAKTCGDFNKVAAGNDKELPQYFGYVNGYVSAYNELDSDTFDVLSWQTTDTLLLLLLNRCEQRPHVNFGSAVSTLIKFFAPNRIHEQAGLVRVGSEEDGFVLYEPVYKQVLTALIKQGYEVDDVEQALMRFKSDNKIPDSKNLYQMLLLKLMSTQHE